MHQESQTCWGKANKIRLERDGDGNQRDGLARPGVATLHGRRGLRALLLGLLVHGVRTSSGLLQCQMVEVVVVRTPVEASCVMLPPVVTIRGLVPLVIHGRIAVAVDALAHGMVTLAQNPARQCVEVFVLMGEV